MSRDLPERVSRTKGREATQGVIPGRFALSVGMPSLPCPPGWRWTALTDVAQLESGHTPSRQHDEYWNGGVPWIGIKDAVNNHGRTIHHTYQQVSQLGLDNSSARLLPAGTVCLSRTASVGYVVVMGCPMATSQDFVNWVCGKRLDATYLKYVLIAENDSLLQFASGTTHQTIYYPEAKAFHALLPPIADQRAIARVLSALDDKIELNRRTNETLEAMARALFKSWFGNDSESSSGAHSRTPRASELEGQGILRIGDGYRAKNEELASHGVPFARAGDVLDGDVRNAVERLHPDRLRFAADKVSRPGDVVFTSKGTVGRFALVRAQTCEVVYSPQLCFWRSLDHTRLQPLFLYHWMTSRAFLEQIDRVKGQTDMAEYVSLRDQRAMEVALPPPDEQREFARVVAPLDASIDNHRTESRTLAALRDALLPRLLSGELRVRDAERLAERAL